MTNVTLAIPEEALRRARVRAVIDGTTVNAQVREFILGYANMSADESSAGEKLIELSRNQHGGSGPEGRTWTRDSLYER